MNAQTRQIFVIIVHYGSAVPTRRVIESLHAGEVQPQEIIVIDHADVPLRWPPRAGLTVIRPATNRGYGAGANIGLGLLLTRTIVGHDIVIVINNDLTVARETLRHVQLWWQQQALGTLAGVMMREGQTLYRGAGVVNPLTGRTALLGSQDQRSPTYIHGAFVMAPYQTWLALHGWPEQYFLYWEDVLLGYRARRLGITCCVATPITVAHAAASASPQHLYYLVRNGATFLQHEQSWWWRGYWWLVNRLRLVWHRYRGHTAVANALSDATCGQLGQRQSV